MWPDIAFCSVQTTFPWFPRVLTPGASDFPLEVCDVLRHEVSEHLLESVAVSQIIGLLVLLPYSFDKKYIEGIIYKQAKYLM